MLFRSSALQVRPYFPTGYTAGQPINVAAAVTGVPTGTTVQVYLRYKASDATGDLSSFTSVAMTATGTCAGTVAPAGADPAVTHCGTVASAPTAGLDFYVTANDNSSPPNFTKARAATTSAFAKRRRTRFSPSASRLAPMQATLKPCVLRIA